MLRLNSPDPRSSGLFCQAEVHTEHARESEWYSHVIPTEGQTTNRADAPSPQLQRTRQTHRSFSQGESNIPARASLSLFLAQPENRRYGGLIPQLPSGHATARPTSSGWMVPPPPPPPPSTTRPRS